MVILPSRFIRFIRPASTGTKLFDISNSSIIYLRKNIRYHNTTPKLATIDFSDGKSAFQNRTTLELSRSYVVFRLCTIQPLVKNANTLLSTSYRIFGKTLTNAIVKRTFFAQFVAGEDENDIKPALGRLKESGVGAILDYAAESDVPSTKPSTPPSSTETNNKTNTGVRTFSSSTVNKPIPIEPNQAELEANLEHSILGVKTARDCGGFAAVKLTALSNPELLVDISTLLHTHRRSFRALREQALASSSSSSTTTTDSISNPYLDVRITLDDLTRILRKRDPSLSHTTINSIFTAFDYTNDKSIGYLEWCDVAALLTLGDEQDAKTFTRLAFGIEHKGTVQDLITLLQLDDNTNPSIDTEIRRSQLRQQWTAVRKRAHTLAQVAAENKVTIMVDAEQTYLQPAIDMLTIELQRRYNRPIEASKIWIEPLIAHMRALATKEQGGNAALGRLPAWARTWPYTSKEMMASRDERHIPACSSTTNNNTNTSSTNPSNTSSSSNPASNYANYLTNQIGSNTIGMQIPAAVHQHTSNNNANNAGGGRDHSSHLPYGTYPVVFLTLQAYLRDCPSRLSLALARARRERYLCGVKLVRGAYMIQERARAKELGYNDPIHPNIQATHACYDSCADTLLRAASEGWAEVMIASHNESSVMRVVQRMKDLGLDPTTSGVSFGQLLGMCDHISLSLGAAKYSVHKYVPYGPVAGVVPYLIRRAQENSDILGGVGKEIRLLQTELKRRIFNK